MVKGAKDSSLSIAFYTPGPALLSCFQSLLVGWKAAAVNSWRDFLGTASWAPVCYSTQPVAGSPGARVGKAGRLQHMAEEAASWALSKLSPVSAPGSGGCGQGCSPEGTLGLTPSLSGKWSSDLIFSILKCGNWFHSQSDPLTQPALVGVSRTIACSYAVGYSLVTSLLPIPFHSRAVNHKWDPCSMLFSCLLYPVFFSKRPCSWWVTSHPSFSGFCRRAGSSSESQIEPHIVILEGLGKLIVFRASQSASSLTDVSYIQGSEGSTELVLAKPLSAPWAPLCSTARPAQWWGGSLRLRRDAWVSHTDLG